VNDCVWYLRAENAEEKNKWLEILEKSRVRKLLINFVFSFKVRTCEEHNLHNYIFEINNSSVFRKLRKL